MPALALFGHWLDIATSPFVLVAPLILALATGRRWIVRLGTVLLAVSLSALSALGATLPHAAVLLGLGALAGLVVAEIWLALVLPLAAGLYRAVKRLRRFF